MGQCKSSQFIFYFASKVFRGFVAFGGNGRLMKVVHNLTTDTHDLYNPVDSSTPLPISLKGTTYQIKGACFAEDGRVVVYSGKVPSRSQDPDEGYIHVYNIDREEDEQRCLPHDSEGPRNCQHHF